MSSRLFIAAAASLALAGCQTAPLPQAGSLDAGFGEAVKYDMALQTIDPDPVYNAERRPTRRQRRARRGGGQALSHRHRQGGRDAGDHQSSVRLRRRAAMRLPCVEHRHG